jgi:hypothetical protein
MARGNRRFVKTNRREFLTGTGATLAFGAVGALAGHASSAAILPAGDVVTSRIEHNPFLCAGCGVCSLMCSLYYEGDHYCSVQIGTCQRSLRGYVFA